MKRLFVGLLLGASLAWGGSLDDGKAAFGREDWRGAAQSLNQFLTENPDAPDAPAAAFLRAVALYQTGDFRASLDGFQKLERTWPRSAYASRLPYWKGAAALAAGQNALAERESLAQTQIPDQEPFTTRAFLNLGLARVALGKTSAAEAFQAFTKASREAPLLAQAWAVWADLEKKAGHHDIALTYYRASSEAHPGDAWDLWSRTQVVDLLTAQGRWDEAAQELEEASQKFPAEDARWNSRRILVARGLGENAALARALETQWGRESDAKKKQDLAVNRARVAEETGNPSPEWWLKASQGPDAVAGLAAVLRYAYLLEKEGRFLPAAEALEGWARDRKVAGGEEARSRAAQDWLVGQNPNRAVQTWDRLVTDFPQSARMPGWLLARGRVRLEAGDTSRALVDFSRILKDFPNAVEGAEARYQTGLVYLKRQEPARAEAWFYGLVQELGSGDLYERALLARGISFVNAGKTDLARGSLQRLIREAPTGVWTGEAWNALGRNALQASLFDEAADAYLQAESALTDPEAKAQALWSRAEALATRPTSVDLASAAYARYAEDYPKPPRAAEARYRQGAVYTPGKDWARALDVWTQVVGWVSGPALVQVREGMATALLRLGRIEEGWAQLETLEAAVPSPESWYRWGLVASSLGESAWSAKAFQFLLQTHPSSSVAEAALPRAAGALLSGGKPDEALERYADYFRKFGRQPSSAPVARAAAAGALAFPATLEALVKASATWGLAPEVAAEFSLAWAQSRLDAEPGAVGELEALSQNAPWTSQRSEALLILGKWHLAHGRMAEARKVLIPASNLGDDVSLFKARWALAQVTEAEGDLITSARQRESTEKAAGPGVPVEFRVQILQEAAASWSKAGKGDDTQRVNKRLQSLNP